MKTKAIIIGSSGRVGQALTKELCALYETVIVVARTPPRRISENMHVYHIQNFADLSQTMQAMSIGEDTHAFSCLGLGKKDASSIDELHQVNVEFNVAFAKACHDKGVKHFFYLSKEGVNDKHAMRHDELSMRAKVEKELLAIGFDKLSIFRLAELTVPKTKLSLATLGQVGINFAKNATQKATQFIQWHKQKPLTPAQVAVAMSLVAYELTNRHYKVHTKHKIISHEQMWAMTQRHAEH